MKFKEGTLVEVLRRSNEPCCSWFPAIIVSVGGCKYTVKYEFFLTIDGESVIEKVRAEDVRPHPPPLGKFGERWMLDDMAEVFDIHSWKAGKVVKVLHNNWFVIRLFGCTHGKEYHKISLRVRQAWHNNKWTVLGKVDGDKKINHNHTQDSSKHFENLGCEVQVEVDMKTTYGLAFRKAFPPMEAVKRNPNFHFESSPDEKVKEGGKKRKSTTRVGDCHGLATRTFSLPKQVDAVSFPKTVAGEKCMQSSVKDRIIGYYGMDIEREKTEKIDVHPFSMPIPVIEENNDCSVASCSGNYIPDHTSRDTTGMSFDDAESSCPSYSRRKFSNHVEDELAANVHKLEMQAYKCTVQALYASGPLSWEQESLLTNLRLSLNISNEEHLLQLRHLLTAQVL